MRLFMGGGAVLGLLLGLNYYVKQSQFHVFVRQRNHFIILHTLSKFGKRMFQFGQKKHRHNHHDLFMGGGAVLGLLLGLNYYVKQSQFHVFGVTTIIIAFFIILHTLSKFGKRMFQFGQKKHRHNHHDVKPGRLWG